MKICNVCGNIHSRFDNYCFHCGNENFRRNICSKCGQLNDDYNDKCNNCNAALEPVKIKDMDFLLDNYDYYNNLIENYDITPEKYNQFLDEIFLDINENIIEGASIKEIILNYASNFAECIPKSRSLAYGYCEGDVIYYDDRLNDAIQTVTIIHELTHVILYKLFLNLFCDIFNVKPSSTIKGFAWFFLNFGIFYLLNEYIANSVESSYAPFQYHNFGSFWEIYEKLDVDNEELEVLYLMGNGVIDDLIFRLNRFINPDLKKQIEKQYMKDGESPNSNPLPTDNIEKLKTEEICNIFMNFLKAYYKKFSTPVTENDYELIEELKYSIEKFENKNNKLI